MARYIFLLALCFAAFTALAQDYPKCSYKYFKNGKVSVSECFDSDHRFGRAKAYSKAGGVIFERELRSVGGHSYVRYEFYNSGAVKRASWRSAPDAGIQWYSNVTDFSEDGNVTSFMEDNYDHSPGVTTTRFKPVTKPPAIKQETVAFCAVVYSSEIWCINTTRHPISVNVTRSRSGNDHHTVTIVPGDTAKCGNVILAEQFADPKSYYSFSAAYTGGRARRKLAVVNAAIAPLQFSKEVRRYFVAVKRL